MVRRVKSKVGLTGEWVNSDVVVGDGQGAGREAGPAVRAARGAWLPRARRHVVLRVGQPRLGICLTRLTSENASLRLCADGPRIGRGSSKRRVLRVEDERTRYGGGGMSQTHCWIPTIVARGAWRRPLAALIGVVALGCSRLLGTPPSPSLSSIANPGRIAGLVATLLLACSAPTGTTRLAGIRLSIYRDSLLVGDTVRLTATAINTAATVVPSAPISWSSTNAAVVLVTSSDPGTTALLTARAPGSATIVVSSEGVTERIPIAVAQFVNLAGLWDFRDQLGVCADSGSFSITQSDTTLAGASALVGGCGMPQPRYAVGPDSLSGTETPAGVTMSIDGAQSAPCTYVATLDASARDTITGTVRCAGVGGGSFIAIHARPVARLSLGNTVDGLVVGDSDVVAARLTDGAGNPVFLRPVQWSSSAPAVAAVTSNGQIFGIAPGSATITATSGGVAGTFQLVVSNRVSFSAQPIGDGAGMATAINHFGVAVGSIAVQSGGAHAFRWDAGSGATDLGILPGDTGSIATAINDSGVIVGQSIARDGSTRAFVWTRARGMSSIQGMDAAYSVNENGLVVGDSESHAVIWDSKSGVTTLPPLAGEGRSIGLGVNDAGEVVGTSTRASTLHCKISYVLGQHLVCTGLASNSIPTIWTRVPGTAQFLPASAPGNGGGVATAINDSGTIIGYNGTAFVLAPNAVGGSSVRYLPRGLQALALDNAGDVVGTATIAALPTIPAIWPTGGGVAFLSNSSGQALGINDVGQVVGYIQDGSITRAMLWTITTSRARPRGTR